MSPGQRLLERLRQHSSAWLGSAKPDGWLLRENDCLALRAGRI
jgi:hypothetical protein